MSAPDSVEFEYSRAQIVAYAVIGLIILIIAFPTIQSILYKAVIGTPSIAQWGLVSGALLVLAFQRESNAIFTLAILIFVGLGLVAGPVAGGVYAHTDVAETIEADATELDTLPNTSTESVRVLPRSVSDNYAQSSMQFPQYQLSSSDITYQDGNYKWSYGLIPDNFFVSLLNTQRGALYVNMTTTEKSVSIEDTNFQTGRGQLLFDSYRYQSVLHSPLKRHNWDTTFNAKAGNSSYIAHSTTTYDWRFRLAPLPQLYAVPQHGSVEIMRPDGRIQSLSPSAAEDSPLLVGQNFYPYNIAMFKVESMQFKNGALNKWFFKEDVLAIADLPERGNSWPVVVPTGSDAPRLDYFIATEPTGSGDGIYEVWVTDGQSGDLSVQSYTESQIGPQKAVDFVEQRPQVNRLSNAEAVAPVPVVRGETLFWHTKVVPSRRSGIVYTAFVNAESGAVTLVDGTEPIYAFLTQEEFEQQQEDNTDATTDTVEVTVVVTDDSGEIVGTRNITVPQGGNVSINIDNDRQNNTSQP
jgi:hypothetical protein